MAEQGEKPLLSREERARVNKAARQLSAYTTLMRWAANFRKGEIVRHPAHEQVMLLSPMLSGRFSYALDGDTLFLGVQPFEGAWLFGLPLVSASITDSRLYLSTESVLCIERTLPGLALGIHLADLGRRDELARARYLQLIEVTVHNGEVVSVGRAMGPGIAMREGDPVEQLARVAREVIARADISRVL